MKKIFLVAIVAFNLVCGQWKEKELQKPPKNIDPVYMMDISKYPKFSAKIILSSGEEVNFCCPKSMFDFYFRPFNYPEYRVEKEKDFKKLLVKDYLSGKWIDAKKALFVFGSRLQGPKGDDLIPVRSKDVLNIYMLKYGGSKVLTFADIRKRGFAIIKFLDMP
jgi:nitrous oxide reductase accessory protein NosL